MPPKQRKNKTTLITFLVLMLSLVVVNFVMVAPYLLAVLMGGILALISRPVYAWLRARGRGPKTAGALVTLGVFLGVVGPVALFTVAVVDQAVEVGKHISQNKTVSFESAKSMLTHWKPLRTIVGDAPEVEKQLREGMQKAGTFLSQALLGLFGSLPELLLQIVLALISCYFLLIDGRMFYTWVRERIPMDADVRERFFGSFHATAVSSLLSTVVAAVVQALIMFVAFLALGVPGAALAAGATFFFAWIPFLGSTPVAIVGIVYLYTQGETGRLIAMIAFAVVCGVSDNIVRPLVLKGKDDMHPLVGLVSIFGGIVMFGLFGVFIGPILTALMLSVLQIWPDVGRRFGLLDTPQWTAAPSSATEPPPAYTGGALILPPETTSHH